MEKQNKFLFLKNHEFCYKHSDNLYQFKTFHDGKDYRGLIGIPKNESKEFWYKYFIKEDSESYNNNTPLEELPKWFHELVTRANEIVTKRDRVRKIVNNYKRRNA